MSKKRIAENLKLGLQPGHTFDVLVGGVIVTAVVDPEDDRWYAGGSGDDVTDGEFLGELLRRRADDDGCRYYLRGQWIYQYDREMTPKGFLCSASVAEVFGFRMRNHG